MELTAHHGKKVFNNFLGENNYEKFRSGYFIS